MGRVQPLPDVRNRAAVGRGRRAGKSTVLLHLAAAHALIRDWLGALPEGGPAILVDCEDGENIIRWRLGPICNHYGVTFADLIKGGLHIISLVGHDPILAVATRSGKLETTPRYKQLLGAAGDIKPKFIGIASSANVFAGSEIDRSQVQQFAGLTTKIAKTAGGYLALASHPSLTGINNDTGLSGSTQWHNAVRARAYLKSVNAEPGEQPESDLRELIFKKNQYGRKGETIVLRYQNGMFLPERGVSDLEKLAHDAKAEETFLELMKLHDDRGDTMSHKTTANNYAPSMFAKDTQAKDRKLRKGDFEGAMARLLDKAVFGSKSMAERHSRAPRLSQHDRRHAPPVTHPPAYSYRARDRRVTPLWRYRLGAMSPASRTRPAVAPVKTASASP